MPRVFVDTNVLFPFSVMDRMLALTEDSAHEWVRSDHLLAEWERVIVREHRRSAAAASAITAAIREYFPEGRVAAEAYRHLVAAMPSRDPDDRYHIAAAVAGAADTLITWNRADFPGGPLAQLGIRVVDPDTYLRELLGEIPDEVVHTVARVAAGKRRPPMTVYDVIDALGKAGTPGFAAELRQRLDQSSGGDTGGRPPAG